MRRLSVGHLTNEMQDVLETHESFVLPGTDDFYVHKAMFNREEDFL